MHATAEAQKFYNELALALQSRGIKSEMGSADDRGYDQLKVAVHKSEITIGVGYMPSEDGFETFVEWSKTSDGDFIDGNAYPSRPPVSVVDNTVAEYAARAIQMGRDGSL